MLKRQFLQLYLEYEIQIKLCKNDIPNSLCSPVSGFQTLTSIHCNGDM